MSFPFNVCFLTGYLCDPDTVPGLAHFCEHMAFLGTDKVRMSTCPVHTYNNIF